MLFSLEIVHDLLSVFDDDGQCRDVVLLTTLELAQQQVQQWSSAYPFDTTTALEDITDYFARR